MATLRDLGLSEYEARVYRTLLRTGPTTAKELSEASDVPMGRIYDVLNSLGSVGVVRSQEASRPKKYAPADPDAALEQLLETQREQLETELRQYQEIVDELADELEADDRGGEQFWTVAIGPEDTIDLLVDRLGAARERIVMVASTPVSGFDIGEIGDRVATALETVLDRGVDVSLLVSPDLVEAIPPDLNRRYERLLVDQEGFEVRVSDDITGTFNLIDRTEVCIEVRNPLSEDEAFALIDLTDPTFAANVYEEFRPRWEGARRYQ